MFGVISNAKKIALQATLNSEVLTHKQLIAMKAKFVFAKNVVEIVKAVLDQKLINVLIV